ncbi:unnamed protein product [Anisakis simplex]|uniref:ES2 similar protein 2 (inferred by orthology to a C. elegans protein) n=1 Tax=Anisakis simplex TaxID=6269 RepID=A0A0M3JNP5_ANISI|nr:unnamed protein product [Anisakis simplex]
MVKLGVKTLKTVKEVRVVLPEEEYLGKLQDIIVRDYFPELPKLKVIFISFFVSIYSMCKHFTVNTNSVSVGKEINSHKFIHNNFSSR